MCLLTRRFAVVSGQNHSVTITWFVHAQSSSPAAIMRDILLGSDVARNT